MKTLAVTLSFLWLFAAVGANADEGFFLEPAATYEMGNNTLTWPSPLNNSTGTVRGLGLDLKAGLHFAAVGFVALDAAYSKPRFTSSANGYDADASSTLFGVVAGAQMPIVGLRVWGGYLFDGTLDPDASNGTKVKFTSANGYKLGVGFHVLVVSLNLEYADVKYTSTLETLGSLSTNAGLGPLENKTTILSVSFPLNL